MFNVNPFRDAQNKYKFHDTHCTDRLDWMITCLRCDTKSKLEATQHCGGPEKQNLLVDLRFEPRLAFAVHILGPSIELSGAELLKNVIQLA